MFLREVGRRPEEFAETILRQGRNLATRRIRRMARRGRRRLRYPGWKVSRGMAARRRLVRGVARYGG